MNSVPPIDAAMPRTVLPESTGAAPGAAVQGSAFADVMRSVFSPAPAPTSALHPSDPSISSRSQSSRSQSSSGRDASAADKNVSTDASPDVTQAGQGLKGNSSASATNGAGGAATQSSDSSTQDAVQSGDGSTQTQGQITAPAQAGNNAERSGVASGKNDSGSATRSASLSAVTAKKEAQSAKGPGSSSVGLGGASPGSIAGAAVSPVIAANVPVTVTNTPAARALPSAPAGTSTTGNATGGSKPTGKGTPSEDSIASALATAPALPASIPQEDATGGEDAIEQQVGESVKPAGILPDGVGISGRGMARGPSLASAHEAQAAQAEQRNDGKQIAAGNSAGVASATSSSSINRNASADGSQAAQKGQDSSANASANAAANASANASANPASDERTSSASTMSTLDGAGDNVSAANSGNRDSTSTPAGNNRGNRSSASAPSSNTATAKGSAGALASSIPPSGTGTPHETAAGLSLGTPNSPSIFSASSHAGATGNPLATTGNPVAARGTPSDAFTALDSAATGERGVLLHAAPHQVAVGVSDPSLGWVEVRAERVAGQVTAALATNSAASHAALTSVLPSMATYLQEHHAGVQQVHVETGLAGGQPGTGSQGQPSPQSDARANAENAATAIPGDNGWPAAPAGTRTMLAAQGASSMIEGHHFSIRA